MLRELQAKYKKLQKNCSVCLHLKRREVVNGILNFSGSCQEILAG